MNQLIDILYWIKCNHNTDININLKIFHSQLSQCINQYFFKTINKIKIKINVFIIIFIY